MALPSKTKIITPPLYGRGIDNFTDNIVGLQTVTGGGLTQGNFDFTTATTEKNNRTFNVGSFSNPINLEDLNISSIEESRRIISSQFKVYPNYDLSDVLNFSMYGSLSKRLSVSITNIINQFPASLEVYYLNSEFNTGATAQNIVYNEDSDETTFEVNIDRIANPFEIDFSENATRNLNLREIKVSIYRNLPETYLDYCISYNDNIFKVVDFTPSANLTSGVLEFVVQGAPFGTGSTFYNDYQIRPNDFIVDKIFLEDLDEIERFLTNRLIQPEYTAIFQIPQQNDFGQFYIRNEKLTWPKDGPWNLDIRSPLFLNYIERLQDIANNLDSFKTNLVSRFLVSDSLKEFDTMGQKVEKILQIYGRSFDEIKQFITSLAYVNSVNYNVGNDIPSQLLVNLSQTLGWSSNFSPITDENFLDSVFGNTTTPTYPGYARAQTPTELNYQFYRNLILNSAYLFKSKGTRRSIEFLLRLIGAPDSLIEFNEHIYLADQKINLDQFNRQWARISGGTFANEFTTYNPDVTYKIKGKTFTGLTINTTYQNVSTTLEDYPIDFEGYPKAPEDSEDYFFQIGAGWYESTSSHRSPEEVKITGEIFTGQNFDIQTQLESFSYGQKYLDRFRKFPFMSEGFKLTKQVDNLKSWLSDDDKIRVSTSADYNAYYFVPNEKLILNVKNIELFLNPAQGLVYDVWDQSVKYDYPIPETGFTTGYPVPGGVDSTFINPQPKKKTFFEFYQTFWQNMINVRNRQYITDGKTGGYPTLQSIWWKYLQSEQTVGVPNNKYTYQKLIEYINGLGPYWMKLIEQMIPATTIWNSGTKLENSIFQKQKFVYRRQRGCQLIPVPVDPCYVISNIFDYTCSTEYVDFFIYPWLNGDTNVGDFNGVLLNTINVYLTSSGLTINDCIQESVQATWYVDLKIGNQQIILEQFFVGLGINDVPTNTIWRNALIQYLPNLYEFGFTYYLNGNYLTITNLSYTPKNLNESVSLKVGISLSINCNQ